MLGRLGSGPGALVALVTLAGHVVVPAQAALRQEAWSGRIVNARTGEPIAGATVTPFSGRWQPSQFAMEEPADRPWTLNGVPVGSAIVVGADGAFSLDARSAGSLSLRAPGHLDGIIDLPASRPRQLGRLTLEPATRLRGRLVDASGEPAVGRQVALLHGQSAVDARHRTITDAAGEFRMDGISVGSSVRWLAVEDAGVVHEFEHLPRGAFDLGEIRLPPRFRVTGVVREADGSPVEDAFVGAARVYLNVNTRTDDGHLTWIAAATAPDGSFSLDLPRGYHTLRVQPRGRIVEDIRIDVPAGGLEVGEVRLAPAIEVTGTVLDERGEPLPGVTVIRRPHLNWGWYEGEHALRPASTSADGVYRMRLSTAIDHVHRDGPSVLELSRTPDGAPDAPVVAHQPLRFDGAPLQPVVLEWRGTGIIGRTLQPPPRDLRARPLEVRVRRADGLPATYAGITIRTRGNPPDVEHQHIAGFTDAGGYLLIDEVPDGGYAIHVATAGRRSERSHLDVDSAEQTIEVELGPERAPLVVVLPGGRRTRGTLVGRVIDERGAPVVGATVVAAPQRGRGARRPERGTTSDGDGAFRIEGIDLGRYTVRVEQRGFATLEPIPVSVTGAGMAELVVTLEDGATIVGTIVGLTPEEMRGVWFPTGGPRANPVALREDGRFRLDNISPGRHLLRAETRVGRASQVEIEVPPGVDTVPASIEFADGFSVRGRVLFRGQPVAGGSIAVYGTVDGARISRDLAIDESGGYAAEDLPSGDYRFWVRPMELRSPFIVPVTVEADRELDIQVRGGVLAGRTIDAESGAGITGVRLALDPLVNLGGDTYPPLLAVKPDGSFRVGPIAGVPWRLQASLEGYVTTALVVPLDDQDVEDIVVPLERTSGLLLRFAAAGGSLPEIVELAWQSLDGAREFDYSSLYLEGVPEFRWPIIPMGDGILTVADRDNALVSRRQIDNRGEMHEITLSPAGYLDLVIEGPSDDTRIELQFFDVAGRRLADSGIHSRPGIEGDATIRWRRSIGLPPGAYTLEAVAPDGALWRHAFEVVAGETVRANLR